MLAELARALRGLGKHAEAQRCCAAAVAARPDYARGWLELGYAQAAQGSPAIPGNAPLGLVRTSISCFAFLQCTNAQVWKAEVAAVHTVTSSADLCTEVLIALEACWPVPMMFADCAAVVTGAFADACDSYVRALEIKEESPSAWDSLSMALVAKGQFHLADLADKHDLAALKTSPVVS